MPTSYSLQIDVPGLTATAFTETVRIVTATTLRVYARATILTPVDTGLLRAQNKYRVQRTQLGVIGEVFNDTHYAAAVHDGHREYVVRPVSKKALRFTYKGKVVFARKVTIPAGKGRPWLARALREVAGGEGYNVQT